ncbi:threonine/serine exporter family protein [Curtobacterium flaccumfaciens]|nr:threonine/serine exporter family protein [Curtobacterium flaccumfaciens]
MPRRGVRPGALITNALLELTAADIVTGSSRLVQGLIMLGFMAAGIAAGSALTGLHVDPSSAALVGEVAGVGTDRGGWEAVPPYWVSWVAVVVLAVGLGLVFRSGWRLALVSVAVMTTAYAVVSGITPVWGSVVATGAASALLFVATRLLERLVPAVPPRCRSSRRSCCSCRERSGSSRSPRSTRWRWRRRSPPS